MNPYTVHAEADDDAASVSSRDDDYCILPIADMEGNPVHYPGEEKEEYKEEPHEEEAVGEEKRSVIAAGLESLKYMYSFALLGFAVVVVMASIFQNQTVGTAEQGIPPGAAFVIFWFLIVWLAMMEGGQGALVGLQPIDESLYAESHPRALKCTSVAHKGDNMERFIVGRQFLVVLVVFVINIMASPINNASVLGFSDIMNEIFLTSGLSVILTTIMIGQLTAQVNAANCMLDFINNYFMLFTIYVSLFIEYSGLLHCVYLVQMLFAKISGTPIESNEPPRTRCTKCILLVTCHHVTCDSRFLFCSDTCRLVSRQDQNVGRRSGCSVSRTILSLNVLCRSNGWHADCSFRSRKPSRGGTC